MYRDFAGRNKLVQIFAAILVLIAVWSMAGAQSEFPKLCIDVDTIKDTSHVSFKVSWKFTDANSEIVTPGAVSSIIVSYTPEATSKNNKKSFSGSSIGNGNCTFDNLKYNQEYTFKVEALGAGGTIGEAWSQPVGVAREEYSEGFWSQMLASYKNSSFPGKMSFILITVFFAFSILIIVPFRTWPTFRSVNIFPYARANRAADKDEYNSLVQMIENSKFAHRIKINKLRIFASDVFTPSFAFIDKYIMRLLFMRYLINLFGKRRRANEYVELAELPTVKILRVGLNLHANHDNINAAFDIRISSEADSVREKGYLEIIWGLGVTSPLLGLYGTVTGLIGAFRRVATEGGPNAQAILKSLGGGINEALWTTFFGLTSGIILMLIYYYYNYKLGRITAIWENIATEISENI